MRTELRGLVCLLFACAAASQALADDPKDVLTSKVIHLQPLTYSTCNPKCSVQPSTYPMDEVRLTRDFIYRRTLKDRTGLQFPIGVEIDATTVPLLATMTKGWRSFRIKGEVLSDRIVLQRFLVSQGAGGGLPVDEKLEVVFRDGKCTAVQTSVDRYRGDSPVRHTLTMTCALADLTSDEQDTGPTRIKAIRFDNVLNEGSGVFSQYLNLRGGAFSFFVSNCLSKQSAELVVFFPGKTGRSQVDFTCPDDPWKTRVVYDAETSIEGGHHVFKATGTFNKYQLKIDIAFDLQDNNCKLIRYFSQTFDANMTTPASSCTVETY